jgi:hypothetical protein
MCNCKELPLAIADLPGGIGLPRGFDFKGASEFPAYFGDLDTEAFLPRLDYGIANYQCQACLQRWYVECAPEQTAYPEFAMKDATGKMTWQSPDVKAQKAFLAVLAHRGFSSGKCLYEHCAALALNGRWVCFAHLS